MRRNSNRRKERYAAKTPSWIDPLKIDQPANVLLIEDNADIQKLLRFFIMSAGACVETLGNGDAVIERMDHPERPDLILLDRMLPGCSGEKLFSRFQAHHEWGQIPVIVLSALNNQPEIDWFIRAGAKGYITKPFAPVDVARQLNFQLSKRQPQKAMLA